MSSLSAELVKIAEQGAAAVLATVVEVDGDGQSRTRRQVSRSATAKSSAETIGDASVVASPWCARATACLRAEKSQIGSAGDS